MALTTQPGPLGVLPPEVTYEDISSMKAALKDHARENGYALTILTSGPRRIVYKCSKSGKYDPKGKDKNMDKSKQRHNTGTTKTDCPFRLTCKVTDIGD